MCLQGLLALFSTFENSKTSIQILRYANREPLKRRTVQLGSSGSNYEPREIEVSQVEVQPARWNSISTQDMRVVIHPTWTINPVCNCLCPPLAKLSTVLGKQDEWFIEDLPIDGPDLTVGAIVRNASRSLRALTIIYWDALIIKCRRNVQ